MIPALVSVTIRMRTVSEANAHEHWRARQKRAKAQRWMVGMVLMPKWRAWLLECVDATPFVTLLGADIPFPMRVTLTRIAPRMLDSDNAVGALKHVRDGVAEVLGVDDGDPRVTWEYAQRRGKVGEYAVTVEVRER